MSATTTLFLRGMPVSVVRRAKAEAARRGDPIGRVVSDAIVKMLGEPAPSEEGLAEDILWFEVNRARLSKRFRGAYVAILDQKVVDHDRDFEALARRAFARYGVRPIFMPRAMAERVVRLRSPRVRRG